MNVLLQNYNSLSGKEKQHLQVVTTEEEYNELISENKEVYIFYNNTYSNNVDVNNLKIVYKEKCMNSIISALYKK